MQPTTAMKTFLAIAEQGSLAGAADMLNVTQSTVTVRLRKLEEDLGQILLLRKKSGVVLTTAGLKFRRYAEQIVNLWQQAQQEIQLVGELTSICRVGLHPDLWRSVGLELSSASRLEHPECALAFITARDAELLRALDAQEIDIAIAYSASTANAIFNLWEEQLVLVSTSPRPRVISNIQDPSYIFVDYGGLFNKQQASAFPTGRAVTPLTFDSAAPALEYLLEKGGSAYLPKTMAEPHLKTNRLFEVDDVAIFKRVVYLTLPVSALDQWNWIVQLFCNMKPEDSRAPACRAGADPHHLARRAAD